VLLAKTLRSSTLKLALIAIAAFGAVVLALLWYVYASTASYVRERSDRAISAEQLGLEGAFARGGRDALVAAIAQHIDNGRLDHAYYLLADRSLASIAGNVDAWPVTFVGARGWGEFKPGGAMPDVGMPARAAFSTLPDGSHLLVGKTLDELHAFLVSIRIALASTLTLLVVLAAVATFLVTRRTVGRIEAINATSRAIMQSGLGQRIPLRGTHDEWDQLAANLNSMLGRIEELMAEVKQVTDNVAHDLRTPLTRMRARLEKARDRGRDGKHDQALIGDTMAELDAVLAVFSALLRISRIEVDDRRMAFRAVDLAGIVRDVAELFDAAAEERGAELVVHAPDRVLVSGDRDLLFDALANLVDNAIKHGGNGGRVTVKVAKREVGSTVTVTDSGPGIPPDERRHVFKRFYRLERSRHTPGNGLGLSLVAAVARLHSAHIELVDNAPGLEFRLCFPSQAPHDMQETEASFD
jgi:signal transduction histidine kinase